MTTSRSSVAVLLPIALATTLAASTPAFAKDGEIRKTGSCTSSSTWKLKVAPDDGRLEVEFEVDSNRVGQTWNWKFFDNGDLVRSGTATTVGPSGSFEVERRIPNLAGSDTIRARAKNPNSGAVCTGTITI